MRGAKTALRDRQDNEKHEIVIDILDCSCYLKMLNFHDHSENQAFDCANIQGEAPAVFLGGIAECY